jgi:hypothetical protein
MTPHTGYDLVPTNIFLSAFSGVAAFVTTSDPILTFALPIALFIIGKGIDVFIQLRRDRKTK